MTSNVPLVFKSCNEALLQVPHDRLLVPSSLDKNGLFELLRQLVPESKALVEGHVEFIIEGKALDSTLREYLERTGLSMEHTLTVTVLPVENSPKHLHSSLTEDWICSMQVAQLMDGQQACMVGLFSGKFLLYRLDSSGILGDASDFTTAIGTLSLPIKAIKHVGLADGSFLCCFAAGCAIYTHRLVVGPKITLDLLKVYEHKDTVQFVELVHDKYLLSADASGNMYCWDASSSFEVATSSKKKHGHNVEEDLLEPLWVRDEGQFCITGFSMPSPAFLVTSSLDSAIRIFSVSLVKSVPKLELLSTFSLVLPLTCLSATYEDAIFTFAVAAVDASIKVYQIACTSNKYIDEAGLKMLRSWKNVTSNGQFVQMLVADTMNPSTCFWSASHDGLVKLWNSSVTNMPLLSIKPATNPMKIFALTEFFVNSRRHLLLGDSSKNLHLYAL